ncbi:MAG: DNA double-strand break repair nuclease NurA, partial [Acidobacteriota bacterium]
MLTRESLNAELTKRSEEFRDFIGEHLSSADAFLSALATIGSAAPEDITSRLNASENPGAVPSRELFSNGGVVLPFSGSWADHQEARRWAAEILDNRTTFAADGSQIYTGKETSLPVAAVQIGWFENPHDATAQYQKNTRFELLTPDILLKDQQDPMDPDIRVEARRYLGEVERIGEFLTSKQGWQERSERMPVAFFDNPLLVPFSQKGLQKSFLNATVELVH